MCKGGVSHGWLWANGYDGALAKMARKDGWTASLENGPEVSTEAAVAKLHSLTDAELAALGLSRTTPAPTTTNNTPPARPTRGRK